MAEKQNEVVAAASEGQPPSAEDVTDANLFERFRNAKIMPDKEELSPEIIELKKAEKTFMDNELLNVVRMSDNDTYPRHRPGKGYCLIIENINFSQHLNLDRREGSEKDSGQLRSFFKTLKFQVDVMEDASYRDIVHKLDTISYDDDLNLDILVVAVLSHGDDGIVYAKDKTYRTSEIWERFTADKCPHLAGKPKIFFFQACQGTKMDEGVSVKLKGTVVTDSMASYRLPIYSDFLLAHSSVKGFYSWRNRTRGSWFIQALVYALAVNGEKHDVVSIITKVCEVVAKTYESNSSNPKFSRKKQIPFFYSTLTAKLYLGPASE